MTPGQAVKLVPGQRIKYSDGMGAMIFSNDDLQIEVLCDDGEEAIISHDDIDLLNTITLEGS